MGLTLICHQGTQYPTLNTVLKFGPKAFKNSFTL